MSALFDRSSVMGMSRSSVSPCFERTLHKEISCSGIGLHSGEVANMRLLAAHEGAGISFIRTDLKGDARFIKARWDNVSRTGWCTVLDNGHGGSVSTVEHLMAAFVGCGIDNAVVEIDGPEVPIMDGSSAPFVAMIEEAGCVLSRMPRRAVKILKPVRVEEGAASASLIPDLITSYHLDIDFAPPPLAIKQSLSFRLDEDAFREEISAARTFGFLSDIEKLRGVGLVKGASLENGIGIGPNGVVNPEGLRFDDEFVRHKILDAVGDLSLAGAAIIGRFEGVRSGHGLNNKLLRSLFADANAWCYVDVPAFPVSPRANAPAWHGEDVLMAVRA